MRMPGKENPTLAEIEAALSSRGLLVVFEYCMSLVLVTLRRPISPYTLPLGIRGRLRGLPYPALSLLLGWWGVPWRFIYTPVVVVTNLCGGRDITAEVWAQLPRWVDHSASF
jgi:hypothetical protein